MPTQREPPAERFEAIHENRRQQDDENGGKADPCDSIEDASRTNVPNETDQREEAKEEEDESNHRNSQDAQNGQPTRPQGVSFI